MKSFRNDREILAILVHQENSSLKRHESKLRETKKKFNNDEIFMSIGL